MVLLSAAAVAVIFIIQDLLLFSYGLWVGSFCILGTIMSMTLFTWITTKLGRKSPLIMLLSFLLGLSVLAVIVFGIKFMPENPWEFGNICK